MANVEHKNLTDPELHEPKGIAGATAGQYYKADGAGSGAWTTIDPKYAQGFIQNNASATVISVVSTPVQVNFGGGFNSNLTNGFTISANGVLTYTGTETTVFFVTYTISGNQASAATKEYHFYISKNGVVIPYSHTHILTDGTNARTVTVDSLVELATNDTISLWVENITDTTNITVVDGKAIAQELGH